MFGCSAAIASASLVAEWLEGASLDEAQALTAERVVETLQLAHEREHVARRAIEAALAAGANARRKRQVRSAKRDDRDY